MEITTSGTSLERRTLERRTACIQIGPDIFWVQTVQLNSCKLNNQLRSRYINGDNTIGDITRASNGLDPDQARHFVEPGLGPNPGRSVKPFLAS